MGLLADYFSSSYSIYKAYFGLRFERDYVYVLVNNDLSTQEIIKQNPGGTKEIGLVLQRSKKYHGINASITLQVDFSKDDYAGGTFLTTAFSNNGIRSDVDCFIYRKNPATNDHDIFYEGKVDFTEKSYSHRPNDRLVRATLHEQGLQNKFLSRDTLKLDITNNIAVDGTTITGVSPVAITYKEVDIYLNANAASITLEWAKDYTASQGYTIESYYTNAVEVYNRIGDRLTFVPASSGQIYTNTSTSDKKIKISIQSGWEAYTNCGASDVINARYRYVVYDSGGTPVQTTTLLTFSNSGEGEKDEFGTVDVETNYITVEPNGYARLYIEVQTTYSTLCNLIFTSLTGTQDVTVYEINVSIGDSVHSSYRAPDVMSQLMRKCTGNNSSFYYDSGEVSDIYSDYVISGLLLRGFPGKGITLSFEEIFNTCSFINPKCLIYDSANNRYKLNQVEEAYQDVQVLSLGKVRDLDISPDGYINDIEGGCIADGKYEQDQGINEFNVRHNFSTSFEIDGKLDLRAPLNLDTIAIELTRREQYASTGLTDTRFDKNNFYVRTIYNQTETNAYYPTGFEGISQYYNTRYNARKCIVNNGPLLAGFFYKDTGESIRFSSNAKDIDITYTDVSTYSLQDDITQAELGTPLFYPVKITFETDITDTQLAAFRSNPHGYVTIEDDDGNEYNLYIDVFELKDYKFTVNIEGKLANINR